MNRITVTCLNPEPESGSHQLSVYVAGDEKSPPLVCVHGLTRQARDFDVLIESLQNRYRIYAPDMPGRGNSDWLKKPEWYHYGVYVADVMALFSQQKLTQVDWVGTSMGGLIGMMIAASFPGVIRKLVINDIGPYIPREALLRIAEYAGKSHQFSNLDQARAYFADVYAPWNIQNPAHLEAMLKHSTRQNPDGSWRLHYDPNIAFTLKDKDGNAFVEKDVDLWEMWAKITCPVLLLRGEKSELLPKNVAEEMQKRHPNLVLKTYANTGHAPSLMEEDQIALIKNWLAE